MYAQECSTVTVETFPMDPQSGQYSYFGVRVSLAQPYYQDVTVNGYIWDGPDDHGYNENHPYTLTIVAGYLTAETAVNFYQTGAAAEGAANITSVSPCPPFALPEDQSHEILLSTEFQNFVQKKNDFLDRISIAVNQGTLLDTIRNAALNRIQNNDYQQFYTLVFGSNQAGLSFFSSYVSIRNALLQANSFAQQHPEIFTCNTCNISLIDETNYFFDNFQTFNTYRFVSAAQQIENGILRPVCGSYWNQLKLGICAAGCGVVSGGLAAGLCGWGCWCTFCTRNSALATVICAN